MQLPAIRCGMPADGPAGIIIHRNATQAAGITCSSHRGGARRRRPEADTVDFSKFASINGFVSGKGIVGRDVRVVAVGLADLIIGNQGTEPKLRCQVEMNGLYMRSGCNTCIGLKVSDDEGSVSLSFCAMAPDGRATRVPKVASVCKAGRLAQACSEREASSMSKGKQNSMIERVGLRVVKYV